MGQSASKALARVAELRCCPPTSAVDVIEGFAELTPQDDGLKRPAMAVDVVFRRSLGPVVEPHGLARMRPVEKDLGKTV